MRILMVSDVYFPRVNGVSTSIETFRRTLAARGVEVRLVVPRYGDEADEPGVIRVAGRPLPGDAEDRLVGWRAMHRAVLAAARDCDAIHIQTPFVAHYAGLAAARRLKLPVLATYHTLFEEYLQHYAPWLPAGWLRYQARAFSRRQCNALDAALVPSTRPLARLLADQYGSATPSTRRWCHRRRCACGSSNTALPSHCTCCRPAFRSTASPLATGPASAFATASRRAARWPCSSVAWHTRKTSVFCSKRYATPAAAAPTCCSSLPARGRR